MNLQESKTKIYKFILFVYLSIMNGHLSLEHNIKSQFPIIQWDHCDFKLNTYWQKCLHWLCRFSIMKIVN